MNIDEADKELFTMINDALKEGRDFTKDEQEYFDKLFDKTLKSLGVVT